MVDKNQAIIDYLITCPSIQNSPLYFNFIDAKEDNKQILITANDKMMDEPYVDGSVLKRFTFSVVDFRSIAYRAIVKDGMHSDENVEEAFQVQEIIDWITEQAEIQNYPDFGSDCFVDSMEATTDNPFLNGVDTTTTPVLAKYSVSIRIQYIDKSKMLWNK